MRTISEICIDADKATEIATFSELWAEVIANKKKYSLVELQFINEHLRGACDLVNEQKFKEVLDLLR
jgi:hypothetical protein